jgi:hypothetical protein
MSMNYSKSALNLFLMILSSAYIAACDDSRKVDTRSPRPVDKQLDANIAPVDLSLAVESYKTQTSLRPYGISKSALMVSDAKQSFKINLPLTKKVVITPMTHAEIQEIQADRVFIRAKAITAEGNVVEWFVNNDIDGAKLRIPSIGLVESEESTIYLEEGRQWFTAKNKSDIALIWATPTMLILREDENLMLIYRVGESFKLNKSKLGAIKRILSVSSQHLVVLDKSESMMMLRFSDSDSKAEVERLKLDLSNTSSIHGVAYMPTSKMLLSFSTVMNKVLDLTAQTYAKIKIYQNFSNSKDSLVTHISDDQHLSLGLDGKIEILNIDRKR